MLKCLSKTVPFLLVLLIPLVAWAAGATKLAFTQAVYADSQGGGLRYPEGVSCGADSFWVADSGNGRLHKYALQNGTAVAGKDVVFAEISQINSLDGVYPIRIHQNSKGELFVLDGKHHRLLRLDPEGQFKGVVEVKGVPGKATIIPKSFAIGQGDGILILDIFSKRILVLDPQGQFQQQIAFPPTDGFFSDLTVSPQGDLLLLDSVKKAVLRKDSKGETFSSMSDKLTEYMNFPVSIITDARGRIFLVDQYGSGIVILGQDGTYLGRQLGMGWAESFLYYPADACVTEQNDFIVADRNNSRVQVYKLLEK